MTDVEIILILTLSLFFLVTGGIGLYLLSINVFNPNGKGAHRKTTRILSKFGAIRRFRVLSNVGYTYKNKVYTVENMLIGYFGILFVHTLGGRGEYYGQIDGKTWQRVLDEKKTTFPNPYLEQQEAIAALRAIFSQNKVFNIPMENIIYLTNRSKKTKLFITNDSQIFLPKKLAPYLDKTKFDKDIGLDINKLVELIETN